MPVPFLTPDILEEEHTAADYLPWVRSLISRLKDEPDGLAQIRLRTGPAKELMNEAFPIGLLASTYFGGSKQVRIRLKVGSQTYDAMVSDDRPQSSSVKHIEVTLAGEGEDDYLRMLVLHESGAVSGLGPITKSGTRRTGLKVDIEGTMVSQTEILSRESDCIARAIERKLGKPYPPNTLLLVAFDDTMAFGRPDNISNIEASVSKFLPQLKAFHSVAIVGMHNGLFLSWGTGSAT